MSDDSSSRGAYRWHSGEIAMQRSVGVADKMELVAQKVIRDFMPDQHREFYAQLPFIVLGSVDREGDAWATIMSGPVGFVSSPNPQLLAVDAARSRLDPADVGMDDGDAVGLLGIELHTRRRNRLNGLVRRQSADEFLISVEYTFGNCSQYIHYRDWNHVDDTAAASQSEIYCSTSIGDRERSMISTADTLFVASYIDRERQRRQVDVAHRGGKPGFIRIESDGSLTIPDYAGNRHFSTLGNFILNPKAGLLFVDFDRGRLLQLSGDAHVNDDSIVTSEFEGAERSWRFMPRRTVLRTEAIPLRWRFRKQSPSFSATD